MILVLLACVGLLAIGIWLALTLWFAGMLHRDEHSPWRRMGNKAMAGLAAGILVVGVVTAIVSSLCSGMRF